MQIHSSATRSECVIAASAGESKRASDKNASGSDGTFAILMAQLNGGGHDQNVHAATATHEAREEPSGDDATVGAVDSHQASKTTHGGAARLGVNGPDAEKTSESKASETPDDSSDPMRSAAVATVAKAPSTEAPASQRTAKAGPVNQIDGTVPQNEAPGQAPVTGAETAAKTNVDAVQPETVEAAATQQPQPASAAATAAMPPHEVADAVVFTEVSLPPVQSVQSPKSSARYEVTPARAQPDAADTAVVMTDAEPISASTASPVQAAAAIAPTDEASVATLNSVESDDAAIQPTQAPKSHASGPAPQAKTAAPELATPPADVAPPDTTANVSSRATFEETLAPTLSETATQTQASPEPKRDVASVARQIDGPRDGSTTNLLATPATNVAMTDKSHASAGANADPTVERPTLKTVADFTVKGVRYLIREGGQTMTVRLEPESLGELRVDVTRNASGGGVSIQLTSTNAAVRGVLESHAHGLREQLVQDGISVSRITISADGGASQTQTSAHSQQSWGEQAPGWSGHHSAPAYSSMQSAQTNEPVVRRAAAHAGSLNVFV